MITCFKCLAKWSLILLLTSSVLSCSASKQIALPQNEAIYIKYIDKEYLKFGEELLTEFKTLKDDKANSLSKKKLKTINKRIQNLATDTIAPYYEYYIFKDSVRVNSSYSTYSYVPKTREKFVYSDGLDGRRMFKKTQFFDNNRFIKDVIIHKDNRKEILGLDCYLVEYKHSIKAGKYEDLKTFQVYVSDIGNVPLYNYDMLELSRPIGIRGLVLEVIIANDNRLKTVYQHYIAKELQVKKPDKGL
jgi:hypothetical protein